MKFSIAAITGFVSAISAATLPSAFTLVAEGGKTVLTDGRTFNSHPKIESLNLTMVNRERLHRCQHH
jgi:hypothetical protein